MKMKHEFNREKNQWNKKIVFWKDQQNPYASSQAKKKEGTQITNLINEREDITTDPLDSKELI